MKLKKLLIYSPYWHVKGGGERYLISLADCLKDKYKISLSSLADDDKQKLGEFLNIETGDFQAIPKIPNKIDLFSFDAVIWVSDGSIPFIPINRKFLLIQAPLLNEKALQEALSWRGRVKLWGMTILCYSKFVKELVRARYRVKTRVVYPPVEIEQLKPGKKDRLILTVGRFSNTSQYKRPDILIKAFKKLVDDGLTGWRLVVAGITEDDNSRNTATALRALARGYPIAIRENLARERLVSLYKQAKFYWHAAGFGTNLKREPQRAEHFGISTVEAMAAGAVPMVYAAGGQLEIVKDGENGGLWSTTEELINKTLGLINHSNQMNIMAKNAVETAKFFGKEKFCEHVRSLFG